MTRIEAFEALFGSFADHTANSEAWDSIMSDPNPTEIEARDLETDTLDRASDFATRPAFYANGLPAGNAKTVLTAGAAALAASASPPPPPPAASPPPSTPVTNSGVIIDPLADLLAAQLSGTAPSTGRVTILPPGVTTRRSRRDDDEDTDDEDDRPRRKKKSKGHDDDRRGEPKPPPPPPRKSITPDMRRAMQFKTWPHLRDQIVAAAGQARSQDQNLRAQGQQALDKLAMVAVKIQRGQSGMNPPALGWLVQRLLEDLRDRFDLHDPDEFRSRFNIFY